MRAEGCRCTQPILFAAGDTCLRCGHYEDVTINETWRQRARAILHGHLERAHDHEEPAALQEALAA